LSDRPSTVTRLLVPNRGEVAVRVFRACRLLGIESVGVFSEADATARHVREADLAVCVGPAAPTESYLSAGAILEAARRTGADAIHPGYGFLSENAQFAEAVEASGLTWVGPAPAVMHALHTKTGAKQLAAQAGVPIAPSRILDDPAPGAVARAGSEVGYPLLVKAETGGGGKGMLRVDAPDGLLEAVETSRRVSLGAFASDHVYLERFVPRARHIEVQVLGDRHGGVGHLYERECSLQRRHQKIVEESPSPALCPDERETLCADALRFARAAGYDNAGTVEFLFDDATRQHYFLEMNTRLQVEHAVTELVTLSDIVALQILVARGEPLPADFARMLKGHAIEARLYAEDPAAEFLPQAGTLGRVVWPDGPFVRADVGVESGDAVPVFYDPMLAKIIAWGRTRDEALMRLGAALSQTVVQGVATNLAFLRALIDHPDVRAGALHTRWLDERADARVSTFLGVVDDASLVAVAVADAVAGPAARDTAGVRATRDPWDRLRREAPRA